MHFSWDLPPPRERASVGPRIDLRCDDRARRHWTYAAIFAEGLPAGVVGRRIRGDGRTGCDYLDSTALYGYAVVLCRPASRLGRSAGFHYRRAYWQLLTFPHRKRRSKLRLYELRHG